MTSWSSASTSDRGLFPQVIRPRRPERLLGSGEVIAEAPGGLFVVKELVLLIEWLRPLHVVIAVDESRRRETLVTVYEPYPAEWSDDFRRRR